MNNNKDSQLSLIPLDNAVDELFDIEAKAEKKQKYMSYIPSFFTTASLPFRNVNSPVFTRKGSQGITLTLSAKDNIPYGKYGRLLLSVLTTHAVLSHQKDVTVLISYNSLSELLHELQLPRQRGKDIREQLDCFASAQFSFEQKVENTQPKYLFKNLYGEEENTSNETVKVITKTTGNIRFMEAVQYKEIVEEKKDNKKHSGSWVGSIKILLSQEFVGFCQRHAVPIDYTVYKEITSAMGKDLYAWLVFRNNGLKDSVFIPRERLVEQFMPVDENSNAGQETTNYWRIIDQLKDIKNKFYPEVKFDISKDGNGITLFKSPTPIIKDDTRYALITSNI